MSSTTTRVFPATSIIPSNGLIRSPSPLGFDLTTFSTDTILSSCLRRQLESSQLVPSLPSNGLIRSPSPLAFDPTTNCESRRCYKNRDDTNTTNIIGDVSIKKSGSDMGRSIAIPMKRRQSSFISLSTKTESAAGRQATDH